MHELSKQRLWMSIALITSICVFASLAFLVFVWLPDSTQKLFGEPSETLSKPREIYLSIQLFAKNEELTFESNIAGKAATFRVELGKNAQQIAYDLADANLINDAELLSLYWEYKGFDRYIRDGVYMIAQGATGLEIANNLVQGEAGFTRFAFLPGWRKEEIDNLLIAAGLIKNPETIFLESCQLDVDFPPNGIEGYLFPGEYRIPSRSSPIAIYCLFVERFFENIPEGTINLIEERGLSLHEAVILASIVEKEMIDEDESKRIAGVFLNRIEADMPLQSDPTVQYAVATTRGNAPWWNSEISKEDLKIESAYNTYLRDGLPPTPICNPSLDALLSIAYAEEHDYLYFRANCDQSGQHVFSETYEQHLNAACD